MDFDTSINNKQEFVISLGGRLDANTAKDLNFVISKSLDCGYTNILIDCANLREISSAGLDFLLANHNKFCEFNGSLSLKNAPYELEKIINKENANSIIYGKNQINNQVVDKPNQFLKIDNTIFKYYKSLYSHNESNLYAFGNPSKFENLGFTEYDPFLLQYTENTIGLGLGSLSYDIKTSHDSFGEFINIGKYTFHIPPKQNSLPDYQKITNLQEHSCYKLHALYGLQSSNDFNNVVKFSNEDNKAIVLSSLLNMLMKLTKSKAISFVICAKINTFSGIKLINPILNSKSNNVFNHNDFIKNFKIITHNDYNNHIALLVGFVINNTNTLINKFLKPYDLSNSFYTHIHSLIFNYQPIKFSYRDSVNNVIDTFIKDNRALDLCHIINDYANKNETSLTEGICYFNSLNEFKTGEF